MSIRLVISDMDGTLFGRDEQMPDYVQTFAAMLQQKGILFAIATGRSFELAQKFISVLQPTAPCVYANGALIVDQGGKALQDIQFALKPISQILKEADSQGMSVVISSSGRPDSSLRFTDWVRLQQQSFGVYFHEHYPTQAEWESMEAYKVLIKDPARQIARVCRQLDSMGELCAYTEYETGATEIVPPRLNKAEGVAKLAEILSIELSDIMAIGDYSNDIEMMTTVGLGVAVGNALEDVKARAKYVCKEQGAAGVKEAITRFCL